MPILAGLAVLAALSPVVSRDLRHDLSAPLFLIRPKDDAEVVMSAHEPLPLPKAQRREAEPALPGPAVESAPLSFMPSPLLTFEGVGNRNGIGPPDANGDVGPNHYVQWVNLSYAVWDKKGTLLYGPVNGNTIWSGFGGICETRNNGDPIVLYDAIADRWLLSQLAFVDFNDYHQCIAISQTPDPTGAWYRYDFPFSTTLLNDYPKFAVWPDGYYLGVNQYQGPSRTYAGQGVMAFERDKMLQGLPAQTVYINLFSVNPHYGGALPADLDGPVRPPAGSPNLFVEMDDNSFGWTPIDRLSIWKFHVDWATPSASTFGVLGDPDQVIDLGASSYPFDSDLCGYSSSCLPQPGTAEKIAALSDRLMNRVVYRNWGDHESLTLNHSVDVDGTDHAGVRWYELRRTGGDFSIAEAGTHAPDTDNRWMGSAAMDGAGDFAVGYSVASATTNPSIRYAGRLPSDPPGSLPQTEATLVAGGGAQTGITRWGDYSMLSVDPTDDCTFWYTAEYYSATSSTGWGTRVGSFRFPGCGQCPLVGVPVLTVAREGGGTRLSWTPAENALAYDVAEGTLSTLRSTGDFAAAARPCAGNDLAATTILLTESAPPGDGFFYLVRGTATGCRGTYDDGAGSPPLSRDAGIQAASGSCP
jgi:hypothetical protein